VRHNNSFKPTPSARPYLSALGVTNHARAIKHPAIIIVLLIFIVVNITIKFTAL